MSGTLIAVAIVGCLIYVWSMSALGRFLAQLRERSSVALPIATQNAEETQPERERIAS